MVINESESIFILIPCLNEKANLELLLPRIPEKVCGKKVFVIIIDDGSSDGTKEMPLPKHAQILSLLKTSGQGAALHLGYDFALEHGAAYIVTMDGDGQNRPEELDVLLSPVISNTADFVIGSRIIGRSEQGFSIRILGVKVFSLILNVLLGTKITDCSSGFRAMKAAVLKTVANSLSQEQYHSSELLMEVATHNFRIKEVPITFKKRGSGHSKKGATVIYGYCFARTIVSTWLRQKRAQKTG